VEVREEAAYQGPEDQTEPATGDEVWEIRNTKE
jgi:hypothetical protein